MGDKMRLEDFKRWNVDSLKTYLRKRGLKTSTFSKDELCSFAFAASEMGIEVLPSEQELNFSKAQDYQKLLTVGCKKLPDPFDDLSSGWLNETVGMKNWPPTMCLDINNYLLGLGPVGDSSYRQKQRDLKDRLMSDYKEGKAYSYFESKWLGEVLLHSISSDSEFCFLKANCTPSARINNTPHKTWVLINKTSGVIRSGYCTCFAGLGGTCNHIAALLFKVDFAWKTGQTNKTCTDKECTWTKVSGSSSYAARLYPKRIRDMAWRKPDYKKRRKQGTINPSAKKDFTPTCVKDSGFKLQELVGAFFDDRSEAAVFAYAEYDNKNLQEYNPSLDFNVGYTMEVSTDKHVVPVPLTLKDTAKNLSECSLAALNSALGTFSKKQIDALEQATRGQSDSETWLKQREGRITGSVIHSVSTKVASIISRSNFKIDTTSILKKLMGFTKDISSVSSIKYGKSMEPEAKAKYLQVMNAKGHKNIKLVDCGLFVRGDKPYIGASADGLVECCCGHGVLEVKCPLSVSHAIPSGDNLPYLSNVDDCVKLNQNHSYYSQIQTEMAVSNRKWCDFFVYTAHGFHLERIHFDLKKWNQLSSDCEYFFQEHLGPHLLDTVLTEFSHKVQCDISLSKESTTPSSTYEEVLTFPPKGYKSTIGKMKSVRKQILPVCVCDICSDEIKKPDNIKSEEAFGVQCDKCEVWLYLDHVSFDQGTDSATCNCEE